MVDPSRQANLLLQPLVQVLGELHPVPLNLLVATHQD